MPSTEGWDIGLAVMWICTPIICGIFPKRSDLGRQRQVLFHMWELEVDL